MKRLLNEVKSRALMGCKSISRSIKKAVLYVQETCRKLLEVFLKTKAGMFAASHAMITRALLIILVLLIAGGGFLLLKGEKESPLEAAISLEDESTGIQPDLSVPEVLDTGTVDIKTGGSYGEKREKSDLASRSSLMDRVPIHHNNIIEDEIEIEEEDGYLKADRAYQKEHLRSKVVCVDAGHGGKDGGCFYEDLLEKDINLDVALKLGKLLELAGINVVYTRKDDTFIALEKRYRIANDAGADLFISVHSNAMEDGEKWDGTMTLYGDSKRYGGSNAVMNDKKLAALVQEELMKVLGTRDLGIIYRKNLAVLNGTRMPSIIAELAYVTNSKDREKLKRQDFRMNAAKGIYNAVIKALEK